ncbi:arsenate reductase ArsC [candidate division KSB1 bacterium]
MTIHSNADKSSDLIKILVVCTGNSIRSQIAEGFFRYYCDDSFDVQSCGIQSTYVHPLAIATMKEKSIDLSQSLSTDIRDYLDQHFDYIITLSDIAKKLIQDLNQNSSRLEHWDVPDPTSFNGDADTITEKFREIRDIIEKKVIQFLKKNGFQSAQTSHSR